MAGPPQTRLSRHKERSLCHAVFVCSLCMCVLCLETHPFTLATGNERQLKSRARSMAHRDRHTRPISLSSLWPPPSISVSLSPLSVWDILTYLKSVSSTQGSKPLARPRWDYISTSSWYIFILFIFYIFLFPHLPFFLRDQQILDVCDCDCLFVCQYCIIVSEAMKYLALFFHMRDSSLKQHTSSGPAHRFATCGIIDYRYQRKRPPQISWVIINSLWTEINLIPSRASFTAGSTLTTIRFAFLVSALDPLDATNQSMIEVSESFTSEKDLCLTGGGQTWKKGGPAADGQRGSARAAVDVWTDQRPLLTLALEWEFVCMRSSDHHARNETHQSKPTRT